MKRVVDSNMVAHLWANQSQSDARNQQGNFYFDGATIYSYGGHFPIARHVTTKKKQQVILFTTRSYSNTTSKHISQARSAISHLESTVIECHNPTPYGEHDHKANLKDMRERFEATLLSAARARLRTDYLIHEAEIRASYHTRYREAFGLRLDKPLSIPARWKEESLERVKRLKAQEAKRDQKLIHDTLEVLKYWKQGPAILAAQYEGKERPAYNVQKVPVALRVNGEEVETSLGARVPVPHAKRIWKLVSDIKGGVAAPYHHNGHTEHVGSFRVEEIEADGTLRAGCHTIQFEAMAELAATLGW